MPVLGGTIVPAANHLLELCALPVVAGLLCFRARALSRFTPSESNVHSLVGLEVYLEKDSSEI